MRNSNVKEMGVDQKSDFTFVLSNPTDFDCNCCGNNTSFLTNKHNKLPQQQSDIKS